MRGGNFPVLRLPSDCPRQEVPPYRRGYDAVLLPADLCGRLAALSRESGVPLEVVLLTVVFILLYRYTDQEDVCVGVPFAVRFPDDAVDGGGSFPNVLVVRADLSGRPCVGEVMRRVQGAIQEAYARGVLSFSALLEMVSPAQQFNPLYQVSFRFMHAPPVVCDALVLEDRVDWGIAIAETGDGLRCSFTYNAALFVRERMVFVARHFQCLLDAAGSDLNQRLDRLSMVTAEERRLLLPSQRSGLRYARGVCVHALFEAQVDRMPDAVAIVFDCQRVDAGVGSFVGQHLTYGDLNVRANQLAHYLMAHGVAPEVPVVTYADRSVEMMVALLASCKAGGAMIFFDPAEPVERLTVMLQELPGAVVLAQASLLSDLPLWAAQVFAFESIGAVVAGQPSDNPRSGVGSQHAAYIIFTSGSTGKPKGVVISHAMACDSLLMEQVNAQLTAQDRYLLKFASSHREVFFPLITGGTAYIARPGGHQDAGYLVGLISACQISVVSFVPSMLQVLLAEPGFDACRSLRYIATGGEVLPWEVQARLLSLFDVEFHNNYALSEAFYVIPWRCERQGGEGGARRRLPTDMYVVVLDRAFDLAPIGVLGEVYIAGPCLARGYLNQPDLTAARFIPNPFGALVEGSVGGGDVGGTRLYRTGDAARYLVDGSIEFLGRLDDQVKIRGLRVEPGEVSAMLLQHPAVGEAAVLVREDVPGEQVIVAYVVPRSGQQPRGGELRGFLAKRLPSFMLPTYVVLLDSLPLLPNGKLDRFKLPALGHGRPDVVSPWVVPHNDVEVRLAEVWKEVLRLDSVGVLDSFFDLGGHSLLLLQLRRRVQEVFACEVSVAEMFKYPTISSFAGLLGQRVGGAYLRSGSPHVAQRQGGQEPRASLTAHIEAIAVVGLACRFPGAPSIDAFWQNLCGGVESISFFSDAEVLAAGVDVAQVQDASYVKAWGVVGDVLDFDAAFFGLNPREAEIMDPQHRVFLECAWQAFEHAGCDPERFSGLVGVYAGIGSNGYGAALASDPEVVALMGSFPVELANSREALATMLSYKLGLRGPSLVVQTACSTALVAVHLACLSLLHGECGLALAGGVSIKVPEQVGYLYQADGIASPDGHCRAFDVRGQGVVGGNGAGVVVLKRLSDALADGDMIYAVIKGSAINNDGATKVGFTAPSVDGQAAVITAAQARAAVAPDMISYVEAHGAGTPLGDVIEVAALTQAFRRTTSAVGFCALGSVKTNIGHLHEAAGVAGLIKTVLALHHRLIPPSLHFEEPNPHLDFAASPFYVNTELAVWTTGSLPRRAGVSSFGIGGTNAHLVVEEYSHQVRAAEAQPWQVLVLSARSDQAVEMMARNLATYLKQKPDLLLADVAWTLQLGRKMFAHRRAVVCQDLADAVDVLDVRPAQRWLGGVAGMRRPAVVFMFAGLGDQYVGMAWGLYQTEPTFRRDVDDCAQMLLPMLGEDIRDVLYPDREGPPSSARTAPGGIDLRRMLMRDQGSVDSATRRLTEAVSAHPALFVIAYALARLWMRWGVQPQAVVGYSVGEYAAACIAGIISLEDALTLVARRAQVIHSLPRGAMLAVALSEQEVLPLLDGRVSLAVINAPALCVVAGEQAAIEALERALHQRAIVCRRIQATHAFHSAMMVPAFESLAALAESVTLNPPQIPICSNVSGGWMTADEATDPRYWARHMCQTVRFRDNVETLQRGGDCLLLEIGPGQMLCSLALQQRSADSEPSPLIALPSLRSAYEDVPDRAFLLQTIGRLWLVGISVDWVQWYGGEQRTRVPLPTYPFERQRYAIQPRQQRDGRGAATFQVHKKASIADWFYLPVWKQTAPCRPANRAFAGQRRTWLIYLDSVGVGAELARRLAQADQDVVTVMAGQGFAQIDPWHYTITAGAQDESDALFAHLRSLDVVPNAIVHLWSFSLAAASADTDVARFQAAQRLGLYSLLALVRSLSSQQRTDAIRIWAVSDHLHAIENGEQGCPEQAPLLAVCKVAPQELPNIICQSIDFALTERHQATLDGCVTHLLAEMCGPSEDHVVAYRGRRRLVQQYDPVVLEAIESPPRQADGVYLVIGGLEERGFVITERVIDLFRPRLVVTGTVPLPPRDAWDALVEDPQAGPIAMLVRRARQLEERGGVFHFIALDPTDSAHLHAAIEETIARFGRLDKVMYAVEPSGEGLFLPIAATGPAECERYFCQKVFGLYALRDALRQRALDVCVVPTSISSILGGVGAVAAAAASLFADSFTQSQNLLGGAPWVSMNVDSWHTVANPPHIVGRAFANATFHAEEQAEVLRRVLHTRQLSQVIVSSIDLQTRLRQWIDLETIRGGATAQSVSRARHQRPVIGTAYVAPRNALEAQIVERWQSLLGIDQIGVYDSFFDLGGHSVLGIQMIAQMRNDYAINLSLPVLFAAPTIAELAAAVTTMRETPTA